MSRSDRPAEPASRRPVRRDRRPVVAPRAGAPAAPAGAARPARRHRRRVTGDAGFATAEAAVALPTLLAVVGMSAWALVCVGAQLRCVDAARVAARVAARGDSDAQAVRSGAAVAPAGARLTVSREGAQVRVTVQARVRPFGSLAGRLGTITVDADAAAESEDVP